MSDHMTREQMAKVVSETTREQVEKIVADARAKGERPNLRDLDLSAMDLSDMDLCNVDLSRSDLSETNLRGTDLSYARLHSTILTHADLACANLRGTILTYADLIYADLSGAVLHQTTMLRADLTGADLRRAYMHGADLTGADLSGTKMCGLLTDGLPSGRLTFIPTPDGWYLAIGCWEGTIDTLREMIAKDIGWPEARGKEITTRRPMLEVAAAMCENYAAAHPDALDEVRETVERWKKNR